ncbi:MAG: hypothetical protein CL819_11240 [Croceicoccus sp.]|nr:hypothetical protein [Croceicoccus sp.]
MRRQCAARDGDGTGKDQHREERRQTGGFYDHRPIWRQADKEHVTGRAVQYGGSPRLRAARIGTGTGIGIGMGGNQRRIGMNGAGDLAGVPDIERKEHGQRGHRNARDPQRGGAGAACIGPAHPCQTGKCRCEQHRLDRNHARHADQRPDQGGAPPAKRCAGEEGKRDHQRGRDRRIDAERHAVLQHIARRDVAERSQYGGQPVREAPRQCINAHDRHAFADEHRQTRGQDMIDRAAWHIHKPAEAMDVKGLERGLQFAAPKLRDLAVEEELVPIDRPAEDQRALQGEQQDD